MNRLNPLPARWRACRDDAWSQRLTPVRDGEELMYYDGPLVQTRWSAANEESLWVMQDRGRHGDRWSVVVLDTPVLQAILDQGHYHAGFQAAATILLVDERYPRIKAKVKENTYTAYRLPYPWIQKELITALYERDVAEWARARLLWNAAQSVAIDSVTPNA